MAATQYRKETTMGHWVQRHRLVTGVQLKIGLLLMAVIAAVALVIIYNYALSR
jgi:hypothetical protein